MWWTWAAQGYLKSIGVYQATFDESLAIRAEGIVIYSLIQLPLGQSALGDYAWDMWEALTAFTCGFAPMTAQAQPATHAVSGLYLGLNSSANLLPDADISRS